MPDENKMAALEAVGYQVQPACGLCKHSVFKDRSAWGSCPKILYNHIKHTSNEHRQASTHVFGLCPMFEMDDRLGAELTKSGFDRFMGQPE